MRKFVDMRVTLISSVIYIFFGVVLLLIFLSNNKTDIEFKFQKPVNSNFQIYYVATQADYSESTVLNLSVNDSSQLKFELDSNVTNFRLDTNIIDNSTIIIDYLKIGDVIIQSEELKSNIGYVNDIILKDGSKLEIERNGNDPHIQFSNTYEILHNKKIDRFKLGFIYLFIYLISAIIFTVVSNLLYKQVGSYVNKHKILFETIINKINVPILYYILGVASFIFFVLMHIPFIDQNVGSELDPSWLYAMKWANENNIQFGSNFVFTYGPLAFLFINKSLSLYIYVLIFQLTTMLIYLPIFISNTPRKALFALLFAIVTISIDIFSLYSYSIIFLALLLIYRMDRKVYILLYASVVILLTAIFIYVKFMYLPIAILLAIMIDIILIKKVKIVWATPLLMISVFVIWLILYGISGLKEIIPFFILSLEIMSGYNEAMIAYWSQFPIGVFVIFIIYLILIAFIIYKIYSKYINDKFLLFITVISLSAGLFLGFKHGFVRHDGHVISTYISVLITLLMLMYLSIIYKLKDKVFYIIFIILFTALLFPSFFTILGTFKNGSFQKVPDIISRNINNGIMSIFNKDDSKFIRSREKIAIFDKDYYDNKTVDIYSHYQGYVLASELNYKPRPVFQSYSAYTQKLLEANAKSLMDRDNRPQYIFWIVEEIDNRLPMLMDGASWNIILGEYDFDRLDNNIIVLRENGKEALPLKEIADIKVDFSNKNIIDLPKTDKLLFATIDIEYNLLGKLIKFLYRAPEINMTLNIGDGKGTILKHRVISSMMKSPFLLSPYISNNGDFINIKSRINSAPVNSIKFEANYSISIGMNDITEWLATLLIKDEVAIRLYEGENIINFPKVVR